VVSLLIASQLDEAANALLRAHPSRPTVIVPPVDAPWSVAGEVDALLIWPSPAWRGQAERPDEWPGKLRWVQSATAGMDYYPGWVLDAPVVTCARGVSSDAIAEYVLAAIFAHAKGFHRFDPAGPDAWKPAATAPVAGRTVGIVGYGSIGRAVAALALANGMQVVAARRGSAPPDDPRVRMLDPRALFATADDIVLALPETPATRGIIDGDLLSLAKPDAHLINVGRGATVDHHALLTALDRSELGFATLDVTSPEPLPAGSPFYGHPKVRLTPHIASNFRISQPKLHALLAANLDRLIASQPLQGIVDPATGY
jgi:phosphoglycerate dehydrogenase-like enzyme